MAIPALPQIASFRMKVSASSPTTQSLDITGRGKIMVDRIQAFVTVAPAADGSMPFAETVAMVEKQIRLRLALDRNDSRVITIGDVPVSTFQQLAGSAVAVPPFSLVGSDQPTLKLNVPANLFQNAIFTTFGDVNVEVIFWGQAA